MNQKIIILITKLRNEDNERGADNSHFMKETTVESAVWSDVAVRLTKLNDSDADSLCVPEYAWCHSNPSQSFCS